MADINQNSSKELVIEYIIKLILHQNLTPGDQLPTQRELSNTLNISRNTINSALKELENDGFICITPRQGAFVDDFRTKGNINTLLRLTHYSNYFCYEKDIKDLLDFRCFLEQLICRSIIAYTDDDSIQILRSHIEYISSLDENNEIVDYTYIYYEKMALLASNSLIIFFIHGIKDSFKRMLLQYVQKYGKEDLCKNLKYIFEFIQKRDLDGVTKAITASTIDLKDGCYKLK